jgi:polyhydroxyalkanoate synthesis regulator phasin
MWSLQHSTEFARRLKTFEKKQPRELQAMLDNLDTVHKALLAGTKPAQIRFGFVHYEPKGVWGIDQKGGGAKLTQTRMYVFAHEETQRLHLITIGDKRSQGKDIQFCKEYVDALREQSTKASDELPTEDQHHSHDQQEPT